MKWDGTCPTCGAKDGEPCITGETRTQMGSPHIDRTRGWLAGVERQAARVRVARKRTAFMKVCDAIARITELAQTDPEVGGHVLEEMLFGVIEEVSKREDTPKSTKLLCLKALEARDIKWEYRT